MTDQPTLPEDDELEDMDSNEVRERLLRFIVKRDMDRHRDVYDALANE
ncbi:hypothetical protein [Natrinema marinum]|nr:hypothetical protein [Natrinema marinum]